MGDKTDSVYVNGKSVKTDTGSFIGSDTMDLQEIMNKLGRYVKVTVARRKEPRNEDERYLKFSPSDAKYLPKRGEGGGSGGGKGKSDSRKDDEIL